MPREAQSADERRLRDMVDYARRAINCVGTRTLAELLEDPDRVAALCRYVEIVGEASTRVSAQETALLPSINWSAMKGMRNRLIHGYDAVIADIVYDTVVKDLPPLVVTIELHLSNG